MNRIIWLPTLRCNLRCPYCITVTIPNNYSEVDYKEWLTVLDEAEPSVVDFSGGEPFIYKDFVKLVNAIPAKHQVAVTSNLTNFEDALKINRTLISFTCSLHLAESDGFFDKVATLKQAGFPVSVNFVMYPSQAKLVEKYRETCAKYRVPLHEEKCIYVSDLKRGELKQCGVAGNGYYHWMPNGDVYSCVTGWYYNMHVERDDKFFMGNLFDGSFNRFKEPLACDVDCVMACDLQERREKKVNA